jgi:transposase
VTRPSLGRQANACICRKAQRREMAGKAVALRGVSIALACRIFGVSETCYRYSAKLNDENEPIADLLIGLARAKKSWGFGLCFLYLRNVRGYRWNHKRVYRIYRELELNLRIKPRKRLKREKPDALAVPPAVRFKYLDKVHDIDSTRFQTFRGVWNTSGRSMSCGIRIAFFISFNSTCRGRCSIGLWMNTRRTIGCGG